MLTIGLKITSLSSQTLPGHWETTARKVSSQNELKLRPHSWLFEYHTIYMGVM